MKVLKTELKETATVSEIHITMSATLPEARAITGEQVLGFDSDACQERILDLVQTALLVHIPRQGGE